jgi:hypothetical protein
MACLHGGVVSRSELLASLASLERGRESDRQRHRQRDVCHWARVPRASLSCLIVCLLDGLVAAGLVALSKCLAYRCVLELLASWLLGRLATWPGGGGKHLASSCSHAPCAVCARARQRQRQKQRQRQRGGGGGGREEGETDRQRENVSRLLVCIYHRPLAGFVKFVCG